MAAYPLSNLDAHKIARQWLTSFSKASTSGDASTIATVPSFSEMPDTTLNSSCARRPIFFLAENTVLTSGYRLLRTTTLRLGLSGSAQCSHKRTVPIFWIEVHQAVHSIHQDLQRVHPECLQIIQDVRRLIDSGVSDKSIQARIPGTTVPPKWDVYRSSWNHWSCFVSASSWLRWTLNVDTVLNLEVRDRWIWYLARYCAKTKQRRQWIKIWQSKSALNLKYCSLNHRLFNGLVNVVNHYSILSSTCLCFPCPLL